MWLGLCGLALLAAFAPEGGAQGLQPEREPNDTPSVATPLGADDAVVLGNVFPAGDVDVWSFTASAGDRVYAAVQTAFSVAPLPDSVLGLLASDGVTVLESDDNNGVLTPLSSSIAGALIPSAGTYYLRVTHASAGHLLPYHLHFRRQPAGIPTVEVEPNDSAAQAQPLPANGWVSGTHGTSTDQDWFSFSAGAGDTVFASLDLDPERDGTEWQGRLGIGLFGSGLTLSLDNPGDTGPDSEALFMTVKSAGTYMVRVNAATNAIGTYHLSVRIHPASPIGAGCQTYASGLLNLPIADGGTTDATLIVPGHPRIEDVNVSVALTHPSLPDLDAALITPAGNENSLFTDVGSASFQAMDADFDDEAGIPPVFILLQGLAFQPEPSYRLAWLRGEDGGGAWTLRLRDDTLGNAGVLQSWSVTICEPAPGPACTGTPVTVYASDFEGGTGGFTHAGTLDEWARGLPTAAPITTCSSGSRCWKTDLSGTYEPGSDQSLLSPLISLSGLVPPIEVSWAQRYQMDSAWSDTMTVEVHEPGPTHVRTLFQALDGSMTDTVGANATLLSQSAGWGVVRRSLDDYAGRSVQLRWNLTSDAAVQLAGLAVDDVVITACCTAASCDDGNACTNDACSAGAGCVHTGTGPAEVTGLSFSSGKQTLIWNTVATATRYDVVRGLLSTLPVGPGGEGEVCFPDVAATTVTDAQTPGPGTGFWYVVRGDSGCAGSYGAGTSGAPRTTTTCP